MSTGPPVSVVDAHQLASAIKSRTENILIIDSRSFIEHNACHISSAVNVCCSKIVKRRLQQDKLTVKELLVHTCHCDVDDTFDVVVYDQSSKNSDCLPAESFTVILLKKLQSTFNCVNLLSGGFEKFQKFYPDLCEDKTRKCPALTSLSQPCLPIANQGPTRILPFLYLGSQLDALNRELLRDHNITYELNVSTSCPQPEFVPEGHFMRIPVNDTYSEKLLPYFPEAFDFLDKVREGSGCVLVHCLAGISRSPTVAIAYVMRYLHLSSDDGYRYVKSKRPTISPNFNFLGQLLEYEKQLRRENILDVKPEVTSAPPLGSKKRLCRTDMRTSKLSLDIDPKKNDMTNIFMQSRGGDQSPTTALAKLSFDVQHSPFSSEEDNQPSFRQYRSKSCYGDWFRDREDSVAERKESKVLSPVKEIKCDGLISEISTGTPTVRQRPSYQRPFDTFSIDRPECSLQNLSNQILAADIQIQELAKTMGPLKAKGRTSPLKFLESKLLAGSGKSKKESSQPNEKTRSVPEKKFNYKESLMLHPFPFHVEPYRRSDSAGTSGFGSDSSDYIGKRAEQFRLDIDFDDLEDDVIFKSRDEHFQDHDEIDTKFDPFTLTDIPLSEWSPILRSPLSPSESHLLEDLEVEKSSFKAESSGFPSGFPSEDTESFHDSGVPMSPTCVWPRKRVANFDALNARSPTRDKRKYESFSENVSCSSLRTFCFPESHSALKDNPASCKGAYQDCDSGDKMGLYRVQSCPGILSHASSVCALVGESKKYSTQKYFSKSSYLCSDAQEIMSHESCPDVLHLENTWGMQSHRRDFRRNVRSIQVS